MLENPKASGGDKLMAWLGLSANAGMSAVEMYAAVMPVASALSEAN